MEWEAKKGVVIDGNFFAQLRAQSHLQRYLGRKDFLPVEPAKRSLLPLSPRRTQVRLRPVLYQVSGHRQICFRPRGGASASARVPSAA
jgi:hypothetical protein